MPDYGYPPYHENSAKGTVRLTALQRVAQALAGAGQGIAAVRPGYGPLVSGLAGFGQGYTAASASKQAAQEYAMKQQQAQEERDAREVDKAYKMALTKRAEKPEPPEKPQKIDPWNLPEDEKARYYENLRQESAAKARATDEFSNPPWYLDPKYRDTPAAKEAAAAASAKATTDPAAVGSLADAMHSMGYAALQGLGMGAAGLRESVVAEHARRYPNDDLAQISADYRSMSGALNTMQRGVSGSEGFAETARSAMGVLDDTISNLPDSGIVPLNFLLRTAGRAMGNEDITAFDNARQVVNTELGRILGQGFLSNGTQLTDSMRHEIREGMSPNATRGQLRAAMRVLRTDLGFKIQAGQGQITKIRGQIGRGGAPADSSDPFKGLYK